MTYPEFSYIEIYKAIRQYYLDALPGYLPAMPYAVINTSLDSVSSRLRMPGPGQDQHIRHAAINNRETLLLAPDSRKIIYQEIREFIFWMSQNDYLEFDSSIHANYGGGYRPTDKLVRTPTLDF